MSVVYIIIFFILGSVFGSFFTVVGERLPLKISFIKGRSHCDSCGHVLSFIDMIPILSYFLLRGRCRYCHDNINSLSTFMEFFTGVLFSLSYLVFGFSYSLLICLGIVSLLIIISITDINYYIIPDEVLIFFIGYFIILIFLSKGLLVTLFSILSGIVMFIITYLIMLLGNFLFKKESLGGGDIKLMFIVGLLVNPFLGLFVIFFASVLALPISLLILWKRGINLIPFGPFILLSLLFVYFTRIDMNVLINFIRSF